MKEIYELKRANLPLFLYLFRRIKKEGLNKQDITELLERLIAFWTWAKGGFVQQSHMELISQKLKLEKDIEEREREY